MTKRRVKRELLAAQAYIDRLLEAKGKAVVVPKAKSGSFLTGEDVARGGW